MRRLLVWGAVTETGIAVFALLQGGLMPMVAALVGSGLAFSAQIVAVAMLRPAMDAATVEFTKRWAAGMGVRFGSFVVVTAVIIGFRQVLPPAWVGAGYLGALLVLLFGEYRFLR